jgi:hypothetical protein
MTDTVTNVRLGQETFNVNAGTDNKMYQCLCPGGNGDGYEPIPSCDSFCSDTYRINYDPFCDENVPYTDDSTGDDGGSTPPPSSSSPNSGNSPSQMPSFTPTTDNGSGNDDGGGGGGRGGGNSNSNEEIEDEGLGGGAIAGIVVGTLVGIGIFVGAVFIGMGKQHIMAPPRNRDLADAGLAPTAPGSMSAGGRTAASEEVINPVVVQNKPPPVPTRPIEMSLDDVPPPDEPAIAPPDGSAEETVDHV